MRPAHPVRRRPRLAAAALLAALPLAAAGCGKKACFQWTAVEGACPSQEEALAYFENPDCDNGVESIDGPPEFDGELCCYDVTTIEADEFCSGGETVGSGSGPNPSTGTAGTGPTPTPGCFLCVDVLFGGAGGPLCPGSDVLFAAAQTCMCGGACTEACTDNACASPGSFSDPCVECMNDGTAGCGLELNDCLNDTGAPQEG